MPTERALTKLAEQVCADFNRDMPTLQFRPGKNAHTHATGIVMPSRDWALEYRATNPMGYRLLMLHELAHWLMPGRTDDNVEGYEGHTDAFYAKLYALCLLYGVPITAAYEDEITYKPRAARRGMELFVRQVVGKVDIAA